MAVTPDMHRLMEMEGEVRRSKERVKQLWQWIEENNEQIEFRCKQMCSRGYLERGLHHPDCPSDYIIDLEEEE